MALVGLIASCLVAPVARADITISVVPSLVELSAAPGGTGKLAITVYNDGTEGFSVEAGAETYKQGTGDLSAVQWLTVEPARLELQPGQRRQVVVAIRVPRDLPSGSRYAAVTFATGPILSQTPSTSQGNQTVVRGKVGVPLLITVRSEGPLLREAQVARVLPVLGLDGLIGFHAFVHNEGNVYFFTRGRLKLSTDAGKAVGETELPETTAILHTTTEANQAVARYALEPGRYRAWAAVDYGA
ncbi:MAG: hypothetical protein QME94_10400, partial [Anaerolineae bacterium]|nr:hypothetical protein [Anaerolineae bacterium]